MSIYEQKVLPHLDAAYNLARWLTSNDHDAQDVAQEASLRAFKYFDGFHGENARAWLLTIVRNTFYNWLKKIASRKLPGDWMTKRWRLRTFPRTRKRSGAPLPNCRSSFVK
jgi:RNA polymerase sigma factor (sigma-70 family)